MISGYGVKHYTEVLSQDEIDELLTKINSYEKEPEDFKQKPPKKKELTFEDKLKNFNNTLSEDYDLD
jgi:flagellar motor switch protein FliM